MANNAYSQLTLAEVVKRKDPNGNMAAIAEVLSKDNPIIQDMPMVEANNTTSHRCVRRLSLPTGTWRAYNSGITKEASRTEQVDESMGMLECESQVDVDLAALSGNVNEFRNKEAIAHLEGLSQTAATAVIYGNSGTDVEQPMGLAPRLNSLSASNTYWNVLSRGGSGGDTTSIFVVQWGINKIYGIYPKGGQYAGIQRIDMGIQVAQDLAGLDFRVYKEFFKFDFGLAVEDPRCIARLANIETTGSTNIFLEDDLIDLLNRMPMSGSGAVIYCNHVIKTQMEIRLKDKENVNFAVVDGLGGVPIMTFRGIPVKKCDAIVSTETAVS